MYVTMDTIKEILGILKQVLMMKGSASIRTHIYTKVCSRSGQHMFNQFRFRISHQ